MWVRASILGFLLLAVLSGADCIGCCTRIGESLAAYRQSYRAIGRQGMSLNSWDRLILTVVLADSKPSPPRR